MIFRLNRDTISLGAIIWTDLFLVLSGLQINNFQILNIFGFLTLIFLPGLLTLVFLRLGGLPLWAHLSLAIALSILELMVMALIGNTILPFVGVARPLDRVVLLYEFTVLIAMLLVVCWISVAEIRIHIRRYVAFDSARNTALALFPLIFVALGVFGAIRLNNGGSDILTMVMLGGMGVYIGVLFYFCEELGENAISTALFLMALSLLLMTNLRGWYITGHDIQREYQVFELAKNAGIWSIAAYRDPYNACLSITILPTIFVNLLNMADQYVYKFFFQVFFALCPGITYLTTRFFTDKRPAFLAAVYFLAFPIFFTDMPFIVRQEVAFLFYGLMLYVIFEKKLDLYLRRLLFMIMGVGVIFSHYSTTYTVLFIFALVVLCRPLLAKVVNFMAERNIFKKTPLVSLKDQLNQKPKITFTMVLILFFISFLWTVVITDTGGNVVTILEQTIVAVPAGFNGANRSVDAMSLLSFGGVSQAQELQGYINTVVDPLRESALAGTYYLEQSYDQYEITTLPDELVPTTYLGEMLGRIGINVKVAVPLFGEILSKLMELLLPIGLLYLSLKVFIVKKLDDEFYLIVIFCALFVFLNIVLPVLSTQYGIFRALQQSMFVLAIVIVIGSLGIYELAMRGVELLGRVKPTSREQQALIFGVVLAIIFFLFSTAFLAQLTGGDAATLQLNNAGRYYDNYLIKRAEVESIDWLTNILPSDAVGSNSIQFEVETDRYTSNKFISIADLSPYNDIYPGLIRVDSYVFLGWGTINEGRATFFYNGDQVSYSYPVAFLDINKDLIYNDGGSRIYR